MPRWLVLVPLLAACADTSDVLYTRPLVPALEVAPGLFRVTYDPEPDQVRGFTATGDTILFRALRDGHWQILGIPAAGGFGGIEHAGLYRQALSKPLGTLVSLADDRFFSWWQAGNDSNFLGPAGCPPIIPVPGVPPRPDPRLMIAWRFTTLRLGALDGAALSSLPSWPVLTPWGDTTLDLPLVLAFRMRFTFGEQEAENGTNAFGPAVSPDGSLGFYSDGETLWRFDPRVSGGADSAGAGIFPTFSADGAFLAVAIPQGVDSTEVHTASGRGIRACLQDEWTLTAAQWTTAVIRVADRDTVMQLDGTEPVWDPAGTRILVRRAAGYVWIDLATLVETVVPNTDGAFGAAVSPDGAYLAFSKAIDGNVDVYFEKLK